MRTSRYDVAQKFITHNYSNLISGNSIQPLKFVFGEDDYGIFEDLKNLTEKIEKDKTGKYKYVKNPEVYGYHIALLKIESKRIKERTEAEKGPDYNPFTKEEIIVNVPNADEFFSKLAIIANIYNVYTTYASVNSLMDNFFSCGLWLRMTPQDCNDIDGFLSRQIEFLTNIKYLDIIDEIPFDKYTIDGLNETNNDYFESYNRMNLKIYDKENEEALYELPSIHYGIAEENYKKICYIYGIQNLSSIEQNEEIKTTIKKNVKRSGVFPSFILAMKTFIDILISKDIKEIRVPLLEVLNYGYHALYSASYKKTHKRNIEVDSSTLTAEEKGYYDMNNKIFDNYVDNEDFISKTKTETLAYIFYKIQEQYDNIDIDVYDFELRIKPKKNKIIKFGKLN